MGLAKEWKKGVGRRSDGAMVEWGQGGMHMMLMITI